MNPDFMNYLIRIFGVEYDVITALGPSSAVEALKESPKLRVVISDAQLQHKSCLEFFTLLAVKFLERDFYKIVYAVTGFDGEMQLLRNTQNMFNAFVERMAAPKFIIHEVKKGLQLITRVNNF